MRHDPMSHLKSSQARALHRFGLGGKIPQGVTTVGDLRPSQEMVLVVVAAKAQVNTCVPVLVPLVVVVGHLEAQAPHQWQYLAIGWAALEYH
jgi:hypothetical protein